MPTEDLSNQVRAGRSAVPNGWDCGGSTTTAVAGWWT